MSCLGFHGAVIDHDELILSGNVAAGFTGFQVGSPGATKDVI
jgi:hypothetical protein